MIYLVNYANKEFFASQKLNTKTGWEVCNFDKVISYTPDDIDQKFYERNQHILSRKLGNGYFLWKPYIIKKTLETMHNDDYLFYADSGCYFKHSINPIINASHESKQCIIPFDLIHLEYKWTKRDTFVLMNCDKECYYKSRQRLASFCLLKKCKLTMDFINEFINYAQDERVITDIENQCGLGNYEGYIKHRHDQSIFSLLSKKFELKSFRDPSQYGNEMIADYPNSRYGQLIQHTRKKYRPIYRRIYLKIRNMINEDYREKKK